MKKLITKFLFATMLFVSMGNSSMALSPIEEIEILDQHVSDISITFDVENLNLIEGTQYYGVCHSDIDEASVVKKREQPEDSKDWDSVQLMIGPLWPGLEYECMVAIQDEHGRLGMESEVMNITTTQDTFQLGYIYYDAAKDEISVQWGEYWVSGHNKKDSYGYLLNLSTDENEEGVDFLYDYRKLADTFDVEEDLAELNLEAGDKIYAQVAAKRELDEGGESALFAFTNEHFAYLQDGYMSVDCSDPDNLLWGIKVTSDPEYTLMPWESALTVERGEKVVFEAEITSSCVKSDEFEWSYDKEYMDCKVKGDSESSPLHCEAIKEGKTEVKMKGSAKMEDGSNRSATSIIVYTTITESEEKYALEIDIEGATEIPDTQGDKNFSVVLGEKFIITPRAEFSDVDEVETSWLIYSSDYFSCEKENDSDLSPYECVAIKTGGSPSIHLFQAVLMESGEKREISSNYLYADVEENSSYSLDTPKVSTYESNVAVIWDEYKGGGDFNAYAVYWKYGSDFSQGDLVMADPVYVDRDQVDGKGNNVPSYTFRDLKKGKYYFRVGLGSYKDGKWLSHGLYAEKSAVTEVTYDSNIDCSTDSNNSWGIALTSSPAYTKIPMGESFLHLEEGDYVMYSPEITTQCLSQAEYEWKWDKDVLDCEVVGQYDYSPLRCKAKKLGHTDVHLSGSAKMKNGDNRSADSILVGTKVEEKKEHEFRIYSSPNDPINDQLKVKKGDVITFSHNYWKDGDYEWIGNWSTLDCELSPVYISDGSQDPDALKCEVEKNGTSYVRAMYKGDDGEVQYSNTITVATGSSSLPPAGYEDEVLADYAVYDNPFPDTDIHNIGGTAAAELYRRAVIGGFPDGEFKGDRSVNRAELAKFLLLARYGSVENLYNKGKFPDVVEGEWYVKYIIKASRLGVIQGYPDGFFRPAQTVNTAEFLKMISLTFGIQENLAYSYVDVSKAAWYSKYAGAAQKYDMFPERGYLLSPAKALTREEVAVAIYNYLKNR